MSILPPCSINEMWGSRKTSCDGLANKEIKPQLLAKIDRS